MVGRFALTPHLTAPELQTWAMVFVAICVQALPFLVFGVALSAAITAFVPASFWTGALSQTSRSSPCPSPEWRVPCYRAVECASAPVASGLMSRGVAPSAAPAFLLASPAINPVVLIATAVAFPGQP